MRNNIFNPVFILLISFFLASCTEDKPASKQETVTDENVQNNGEATVEKSDPDVYHVSVDRFNNNGMNMVTVEVNSFSETVIAAGYMTVPKENIAEVRTYIGGYLTSSPFLPGDYVTEGQLLVSLENLEYIDMQRDYLKAKEDLIYLKTVYERQVVLSEEKITSENSRQQAESEYNSALADFESLRKMLKLIGINPDKIQPEQISSTINLYSPISGYITKVNAVKGKYVDPTDMIYEIINTNYMQVELKVYEKDILKIKKGMKISFVVPEAN